MVTNIGDTKYFMDIEDFLQPFKALYALEFLMFVTSGMHCSLGHLSCKYTYPPTLPIVYLTDETQATKTKKSIKKQSQQKVTQK